ncbi:CARDB domain-containing protein [Halostella salina]|uniref:CARDB domain-containing protein n=1 Tax=Halostella salina TaxID=1547897 RepID=UPI000EF82167|nr:CARDB domain-containing protein [Halostella salina]
MRFNVLAVVALLLAGLAVPTAAAVAVEDGNTDDAGVVTLHPHDGPNGEYATVRNGELAVELVDLNDEAVTTADRVFSVTADEEPVRVAVEDTSDAVTFYRGGDPSNEVEGRNNAVRLDPGESLAVGVEVDTQGSDAGSLSSFTVVALTPDGEEPVDEEDVYLDSLTGSGAAADGEGFGLANGTLVDIDSTIDRAEVDSGERVAVTATVTNRGNRTATVPVPFRVDGVTVDDRRVRVGAGETRTVTFERRFERSGEYALAVGDREIGPVTVTEPDGPAPDFAVTNATVTDDDVDVGEPATVTATVANDGDADGTFTAELVVDGTVVATQRVAVPAGETRTVTFDRSFRSERDATVGVSGTTAGAVSVGGGDAGLVTPSMIRTSASGAAVVGPLLLGAGLVRQRRRKGL